MSALLATSLYLNGGTGIQPVMSVQSYQGHNSGNNKSSADSDFLNALPEKEQLIIKLAAVLKKPAEVIVKDYLS